MKQLGLLVLFFFAYCAAFSQPDSAHTITDNTYAKKKFLNEQMVARIGKELKQRTPIRTNSIYYDSIFSDDVLKELTWSLSNRGYMCLSLLVAIVSRRLN